MRRGLLVLAMLWSSLAMAGEPESSVHVSAGVGVSVSDASDVFPEFSVEADFPLTTGFRGRAELELTGLPGQDKLDPSDPSTFKAAGGTIALALALMDHKGVGVRDSDGAVVSFVKQRIAVECAGGTWTSFTTRDIEPLDRFVSEATCGIRVEQRSVNGDVERFVSARAGHSGIAGVHNAWTMALVLQGEVQIVEIKGAGLGLRARVDKAFSSSAEGRDRFGINVWGAF